MLSHFTQFLSVLLSANWSWNFLSSSDVAWTVVKMFKGKIKSDVMMILCRFLQSSIAVCVGEWWGHRLRQRQWLHQILVVGLRALIHDFIDCRFLITRARHDVLVVGWNVTAQHWRSFFWLRGKNIKFKLRRTLENRSNTHLEYAGTIRSSPCVQQVIFTRRYEPLSACCKAQWEDTTFM